MGKLRIGIDINEVLRARWLQADRFYVQEFGEDKLSEEVKYVYDIFQEYPWKDTVETIKELKEPEDMPDDINPVHYQVNEKTGEADADSFLFKKEEKIEISAKEQYNRFMYEDYLFEIHGAAPKLYPQLDLDVNNFLQKYENTADFTIISIENRFSIPPTLFFLSKISSRVKNYKFVDNINEIWKEVDVLITTDPAILKLGQPWGKKIIKLKRPYNENINEGSVEVLQVVDLIENKEFQKLIKYKTK